MDISQTYMPPKIKAAWRSEFWRGMVAGLPVLLGVVPYALVLGAQAAQKGLTLAEVPLMTGLNFAGGSEFAAIQLWTSPPHILLIVAITFLVNSRHLLMGAALAPFLKHLPKRTALGALFFMCDESWALGLEDAQKRKSQGFLKAFSLPYYMGVALPLYVMWVLFTLLGAGVGPMMGDLRIYGLDMAFPAVFLVLLAGMWKGFAAARPWFVSLIVAAGFYLIVPGAWYVAAGAVAGLLAAYFLAEKE
ncbi:AzlC family ABC transporter permease [Brucellaceae bacterium C25G]